MALLTLVQFHFVKRITYWPDRVGISDNYGTHVGLSLALHKQLINPEARGVYNRPIRIDGNVFYVWWVGKSVLFDTRLNEEVRTLAQLTGCTYET